MPTSEIPTPQSPDVEGPTAETHPEEVEAEEAPPMNRAQRRAAAGSKRGGAAPSKTVPVPGRRTVPAGRNFSSRRSG